MDGAIGLCSNGPDDVVTMDVVINQDKMQCLGSRHGGQKGDALAARQRGTCHQVPGT